ncbi:MAG: sulfurtransferase-like selenium metabolism protein YedF [Dethiobacteria bacterium]
MHIDKELDNRGLTCPMPVLKTRKALLEIRRETAGKFTLLSIVDNEAAQENVTRMARKEGCQANVESRGDGIYIYISNEVEYENNAEGEGPTGEPMKNHIPGPKDKSRHEKKVILITSSRLGEGEGELGAILMRSFIFSVKEVDFLPDHILFMNSGVFLAVEGSPVLDELMEIEKKGVQLYSCGTCLDFYKLKDKLAVGQVTNMYDTVEILRDATKCLTL